MKRIAIIGGGVSGLSTAHLLKESYDVTVFEKENTPGGLIRCRRMKEGLFHICGGHVFNSKRQDVLDWFWSMFDQGAEFVKADRNAAVSFSDDMFIPYPVENHVYLFGEKVQKSVIADLLQISKEEGRDVRNFEEFLVKRFGPTLYKLYFQPYNEKVWRRDLGKVSLSWLEGKLPMPTVNEILYNNFNHIEEKAFVHSSFWYERSNGSQFLADRLARGIKIEYDNNVEIIEREEGVWNVNGKIFDRVVFCGNIKDLPLILKNIDMSGYVSAIENLEYHGTTSVFCEIDRNPYSWVYQPSRLHSSHRIICTGNFSPTNNAEGLMTGTVEFTDYISKEEVMQNLELIPFHPKYIAHHYNKYTYPIQDKDTRQMITSLKKVLTPNSFFMVGRFADWEYYNMDVAMGAAIDLCNEIKKS